MGEDLGLFRGERNPDGRIFFTPVQAEHDQCVIQVPWLSQLGHGADYASGDCGAACVAMVLNWQRGKIVAVDDVSRATGEPAGFQSLWWTDIMAAASKYGLELQRRISLGLSKLDEEIKSNRPCIALVHYPSLPVKFDSKYQSGHFLVVVGVSSKSIIYHDPYSQKQEGGAFVECPRSDFDKAWGDSTKSGNMARQALLIV